MSFKYQASSIQFPVSSFQFQVSSINMLPHQAKEHNAMKVFIADDSQIMRERLIDLVSDIPEIEITGQAQGGFEATDSIKKLKPDVVILDIRMPNGSGVDVLQEIKNNKLAPLVIMLTNYPYPQYKKKCEAAGADYFFDKATESQKVAEVLEQLVHDSHNKKE